MTERKTARACPIHHCRLDDELACRIGRGRHVCTQWLVVDVKTGVALELVTDAGDSKPINQPLKSVPKMTSLTGEPGMPKAETVKTKGKTTTNVKAHSFEFGQQRLTLTLQHRHDIQDDATRFRVRWVRLTPKGSQSGVSGAFAQEQSARAAFEAEVAKAAQAGWKPCQSRTLTLRPVPGPERGR